MISRMKKLLLGGRVCDKETILQTLREVGVIHIESAQPEKVTVPASLTEDLNKCNKALNELSQIQCVTNEDKIEAPGTPKRLVDETLNHVSILETLKEKLIDFKKELAEVQNWGNIGIEDLNYLKKSGLYIVFAQGGENQKDLVEADFCETVFTLGAQSVYIVISRKEIILPKEWHEIDAPLRDDSQILEDIRQCEKNIANHVHALQCLKLRYEAIKEYQVKLLNQKRFAEVESGVMSDSNIFILTGWCPEKQRENLEKSFIMADIKVGIKYEDPEEGEVPPTLLDNPTYSSSLKPMLDFMGMTPSYNEPDSSFLFLSTLIIFSAFLIADAGYGLIIALPLMFAYKKLAAKGIDTQALRLGIYLGLGAAVYGLLTNSWFGVSFGKDSFLNLGFDPNSTDGTMLLQQLCFFLGVVHLTIAHIWKISRKKMNLSILGEIGWIVFLWAMYSLICPLVAGKDFVVPGGTIYSGHSLTIWLFIVSISMIILFTAPQANPLKMVSAGIGSILSNASSSFSDILSYIRLWAVGLAGSKVAGAFNSIGGMICVNGGAIHYIAAALIVVLGHILNIILAVIAILSHGVRLNLLEFSNHLELEWAGREYVPFKKINN